jgi:PPOX class probable F420-dependent enzyme
MADLTDAGVRELLENPNHAVISSHDEDGWITSTVVWVDVEDGALAVNSSVGRVWPSNLQRDPRATLLITNESNPYEYAEIRGTAEARTDGADAHIDRLAKKYIGQDEYPYRQPGEQRIKFLIKPERIRYVKQ